MLLDGLPRESRWRQTAPGASPWTWSEHLAAAQVNVLAWANWQRGGGKGSKPKPIRPPVNAGRVGKKMGRGMSRYTILVSARGQEWADARLREDPSIAVTYGDGSPMS